MTRSRKEDNSLSHPFFWTTPFVELAAVLESNDQGLSEQEAKTRLLAYGVNSVKASAQQSSFGLFVSQFKSPIILILLFASAVSFFLKDVMNSLVDS